MRSAGALEKERLQHQSMPRTNSRDRWRNTAPRQNHSMRTRPAATQGPIAAAVPSVATVPLSSTYSTREHLVKWGVIACLDGSSHASPSHSIEPQSLFGCTLPVYLCRTGRASGKKINAVYTSHGEDIPRAATNLLTITKHSGGKGSMWP